MDPKVNLVVFLMDGVIECLYVGSEKHHLHLNDYPPVNLLIATNDYHKALVSPHRKCNGFERG